MDENFLLKSALVFGIIGIIALFFAVKSVDRTPDYSEKNNADDYGAEVKAKGMIASITSNGNMSFITINMETELDIVLFEEYPLPLEEGDYIEARGMLEEYEGKDEIIADEIRLIAR